MNVFWSLILYNPLEVLMMLLCCDALMNRDFRLSDISHCYILGSINLLFQMSRVLAPNVAIMLFVDLFVALIVMSFSLYIYYNKCVLKKSFKSGMSLRSAFLSVFLNYISIMFTTIIMNSIFGIVYNSNYLTGYYEFLSNVLIRIIFLLIVFIIKEWGIRDEKRIEEDCK